MILINSHTDIHPPLVLPGVITDLRQTHGKGATQYVVFSGPAAAYNDTGTRGEFNISWEAYRKMHLGERQCVAIHTGLLGLQWWAIGSKDKACSRFA